MSTKFRSQMKEVMQMAWSFVRKNISSVLTIKGNS